jgi:protoporphyrinogen/coproporphyrinogen III oxidase
VTDRPDVIVVGAGISGLALAWKASRDGCRVLVLERENTVGGCIQSHRTSDGFWFEMGGHTAYNSYGAYLDIVEGTGLTGRLVRRGPARARFGLLRAGKYRWLTPPRVLLQLNWFEAAVHFPFGILKSKRGRTIRSYYSGLLGRRNYDRVLAPFLSAVPSQQADEIPAEGPGSLFKNRPRREDLPRSYGFDGGLQAVCDAAAAASGIEARTSVTVIRVEKKASGFAVHTSDGRVIEARLAAVAAPPDHSARMLRDSFPDLARQLARVKTVAVESMGTVLSAEKCWMPLCAFVVPVDDLFYSCVTRDPFPAADRRAFAFHFKGGVPREVKLRRMSEILRVSVGELGDPVERGYTLPAPVLGHDQIVRDIDRCLAHERLTLTGNYFAGLAIEDCVHRSNSEWARVSSSIA